MTSAIDPNFITTDPVSKSGMRTQLQTAADEITALQNGKADNTGDVFSGDVEVNKVHPAFILRKTASGQNNNITGYTGTSARWNIIPGNSATESGSNAGSDFTIGRYTDGGVYIDSPISISRANGFVTIDNGISAPTPSISEDSTLIGNTAWVVDLFSDASRQVKSLPGFQIFPGGLQFKFGTATTASGIVDVTYGTPFATATRLVFVTPFFGSTITGSIPLGTAPGTYSVNGFRAYGDPTQNIAFCYLAIGE